MNGVFSRPTRNIVASAMLVMSPLRNPIVLQWSFHKWPSKNRNTEIFREPFKWRPPIFSKKKSLQASPRRSTSSAEGRDVDHTWPSIVSRRQRQWEKPDWRIGWKMSGFWSDSTLPKSVWVWQCFSSSFSTVNVEPNWHKNMFDKKEFICSHLCEGTNEHHRIKTKASSWELLPKIRLPSYLFFSITIRWSCYKSLVPGPKMRSLVEGTMAFYEGATKISARCVTTPRIFRGLGHDL